MSINVYRLKIENLGCASCASKMESAIRDIEGVFESSINFATKTLHLKMDESLFESSIEIINKTIDKIEPGAFIAVENEFKEYRLKIENLGCANCAVKIEEAINAMEGVEVASVNFASKTLFLKMKESDYTSLIDAIAKKVEEVEPGTRLLYETEVEDKIKNNHALLKLLIPIGLFFVSFVIKNEIIKDMVLLIAYIGSGYNVILTALKNIARREVFDENFLMTIASLGAILIGEFSEGVAVMIFYSVGEYMQDLAVDKSRESIASLMDIRPEFANIMVDGNLVMVDPLEVGLGDVILVKPGEKIPLDARVLSGYSMVDTSALTGESLPREVEPGDEILSGTVNLNSVLELEVTKVYEDSAVSKILELVENSGARKAETEKFITRFAKYYTPVVVFTALALAILPPLLTGDEYSKWIYRALVFLVASCPCALVVSIPLGFFAGIGRASKYGILIKGGNYLEAISKVKRFIFDKTGTLTYGRFSVTEINPEPGLEKDDLLKMAYIAESMSDHPIAESIRAEYGGEPIAITETTDIPGHGIVAAYDGDEILAGNSRLMEKYSIDYTENTGMGTVVYVAVNSKYYGSILISDEIKTEAKSSLQTLKELGVKSFTMLTGDNKSTADLVADTLGIEDVRSEALPQDKVEIVQSIIQKEHSGTTAFVGDGINDAPALILSDIGISMGQVGSDAAIEAADIVIMKDNLETLGSLIKISKHTMRIIYQNIVFALGFKLIVLILGATGRASMWFAVFADTGVAILAILNSIRILRKKA